MNFIPLFCDTKYWSEEWHKFLKAIQEDELDLPKKKWAQIEMVLGSAKVDYSHTFSLWVVILVYTTRKNPTTKLLIAM